MNGKGIRCRCRCRCREVRHCFIKNDMFGPFDLFGGNIQACDLLSCSTWTKVEANDDIIHANLFFTTTRWSGRSHDNQTCKAKQDEDECQLRSSLVRVHGHCEESSCACKGTSRRQRASVKNPWKRSRVQHKEQSQCADEDAQRMSSGESMPCVQGFQQGGDPSAQVQEEQLVCNSQDRVLVCRL